MGDAEASAILAVGKSTAEAYRLAVDSMGSDNFAQFKIMEEIGKNKVKVMPDLLITGGKDGGTSSPVDALLGLKVLENMNRLPERPSTEVKE
jgi:hypothetical protein